MERYIYKVIHNKSKDCISHRSPRDSATGSWVLPKYVEALGSGDHGKQNGIICRDPRSGSINIHEKREKNPSEKPEVAQPPRVFHEDFSRVLSEYYVIC